VIFIVYDGICNGIFLLIKGTTLFVEEVVICLRTISKSQFRLKVFFHQPYSPSGQTSHGKLCSHEAHWSRHAVTIFAAQAEFTILSGFINFDLKI
jgi:hypothetical protein